MLTKPDLQQAQAFLDALDPSGQHTFQTFCDPKNATAEQEKGLARVLHGSLEEHCNVLSGLNGAALPAGIFVTVNRTDQLGRRAKNVIAVRAVFVDLDDAPIGPVLLAPLRPSIVVQSSSGKYHAYWLTDDVPVAEFTAFQKLLAQTFQGDISVSDTPRVLRVPGYYHCKGEPFLTHITELHPERRYTRSQLIQAFGDPVRTATPDRKDAQIEPSSNPTLGRAKAARLAGTAAEKLGRDPAKGRHRQAVALGWDARREELSRDDAEYAAAIYYDLLPATDSNGVNRPISEPEIASAVLNAFAEGKAPNLEAGLEQFFMTGAELGSAEIAPRQFIIQPFITEASLSMVWAKRGVGKTWFAMELAYACATGTKFLAWNVTKQQRVLYIDGEMPLSELKDRANVLFRGSPPDNLTFLPSERLFREARPLRINDPEDQGRIWDALDALEAKGKAPGVLIIDNLSSLTSGMDENSNSDLDVLLLWLLKLRHRGLAVVVVHHAGKNGQQRGASRREDLLDTSIKLEELPLEGRNGSDGAGFTVTFDKVRGKRPDPDTLSAQLVSDGSGNLTWAIGASEKMAKDMEVLVRIYADNPTGQNSLADAMGVKPPRISELMGSLRAKGLVNGGRGLSLTEKGRDLAIKLGGDQRPF